MTTFADPTTARSVIGRARLEVDDFVINDVPLKIPPEQIAISDKSFSNDWQTLRTSGSRRSKSGHALTSISFGVVFNGRDSINDHLRPLIAGLLVTPFCVVHNEYLNSQLAKIRGPVGDTTYEVFKPVTLALTSMTISTIPGKPATLYGQFEFLYFNHLPFCNLWAYKSGDDFATPGPVWDSVLWRRFYKPYLDKMEPIEWPYRNPQLFPFIFRWKEFSIRQAGSLDSLKAAKSLVSTIKNKPDETFSALKDVLGKNTVQANTALSGLFNKLAEKGIISKNEAELLDKVGTDTIEKSSADVVYPLLRRLYSSVEGAQKSAKSAVNENKKEIDSSISLLDTRIKQMKTGQIVDPSTWEEIQELATDFTLSDKSGAKVEMGGYRVFGRNQFFKIHLTNEGIDADEIIEGLSINFSPSLAIIPLAGHTHPTCQFTGGYDTELNITMNMKNSALAHLRRCYHTWEDTNLRFRQIPQGFRNLFVESDFTKLFGITEFQPSGLESTTIPEQPSRSRVVLSLVDAGIASTTQIEDPEALTQEFVASDPALRKEVYKVLEKEFIFGGYKDKPWLISGIKDNNPRNSAFNSRVIEAAGQYNAFTDRVMKFVFLGSSNNIKGSEGRVVGRAVIELNDTTYEWIPGLDRLKRSIMDRKGKGDDSSIGLIKQNDWSIKSAIKKRTLHEYLLSDPDVKKNLSDDYENEKNALTAIHQGMQGLGKLAPGIGAAAHMATATGAALGSQSATSDSPYWNPGDPIGTGREPGALGRMSLEEAAGEKYALLDNLGLFQYQTISRNLMDRIISLHLDLPQFAHLKAARDRAGVGKGKLAYPDFKQSLMSIASFLDINSSEGTLVDYDPDFYMWYPVFDSSSTLHGTIIDASLISQAKQHSLKIFDKAQGDIGDFFQKRYKGLLENSAYKTPWEELKKFTPQGMVSPLYDRVSYQNSSVNEGEGGEDSKRGIKLTIMPDPKKIPTNFYLFKNPEIKSDDSITHSTNMNELWGEVQAGGNNVAQKKPSSNTKSIQPEVGSVQVSSRSNKDLGVKDMVTEWPKPSSFQSPVNGLISPVANYTSAQRLDRGCLEIRDIGQGGIKGEQSFSYRRKGTLSDWKSAPSILQKAGYTDPFKAPNEPAITGTSYYKKSVAKWTAADYFDWKRKTGKKMGYIHKGIDIGATIGTEVYAVADGIVRRVARKAVVGAGLYLEIDHPARPGGIGMSRYLHLQAISPSLKKGGQVQAGECIGVIGVSGYSNMRWAHLHFEVWDKPHEQWEQLTGKVNLLNPLQVSIPWVSGGLSKRKISAKDKKALSSIAQATPQKDVTSTLTSPLMEAIKDFETRLIKGNGQRLVRAYPTFKLYFIEDDSGSRKRLAFDDFFSYDAVSSIRVVRSRKIPADLCVIELTNVSGILTNRKFRHSMLPAKGSDYGPDVRSGANEARDLKGNVVSENNAIDNPMLANTLRENPIASIMLQEGVDIHLKMGYCSDPSMLEPVFTGKIEAVMLSENEDLITIVAQSYATELTQDIKGIEKPLKLSSSSLLGWTAWGLKDSASTGRIFEEMLAQPEVLHFGRWERGDETPNRDVLTNKYQFVPNPADDNIFAPPPSADLDALGKGTIIKSLRYLIYRTTIWDIFKEMELRHPNFIGSPVPYSDKYGERMTYFFGLPNQLYFARSSTPQEQSAQDNLVAQEENVDDVLGKQLAQANIARKTLKTVLGAKVNLPLLGKTSLFGFPQEEALATYDKVFETIYHNSVMGQKVRETIHKIYRKKRLQLAKEAGYIRPFRRYHLLTSNNHIISNNIRADARDVANTIVIKYPKGASATKMAEGAPPWGLTAQLGSDLSTDKEDETFILKLDNALPTEEIRVQIAEPVNVTHDELAKRYALSLLCQNIKDIYKGDVQVLGDGSIKPYDVCLTPETLIFTPKGYCGIKDIEVGDKVYSHKGKQQIVTQIFKRKPEKDLLSFKCSGDPEYLELTPNHPILSIKLDDVYRDGKKWAKRDDFIPQFRSALELCPKDYIAVPRIYSQRSLSTALARLLGYYLAEGNIIWEWRKSFNKRYGKRKHEVFPVRCCRVPVGIQWAFNSETELFMVDEINKLLSELGYIKKVSYSVGKEKKGLSIIFNDRDLASKFIHLAGYCDKDGPKKDNKWMRDFYNEETTKNILSCYFEGDGSLTKKGVKYNIVVGSTRFNLARNVRQMLINLGVPVSSSVNKVEGFLSKTRKSCIYTEPSFCWYNTIPASHSCIFGEYFFNKSRMSVVSGNDEVNQKGNSRSIVDNLYMYLPIKEITKIKKELIPYVYNLGVENDHSYVAANKVVHNCYLLDEQNDMIGPVEVEQVIHTFTRDSGFRTEITPDMVVVAAEWSLLSTLEALSVIVEGSLKNVFGKDAFSLMKGSLSPMTNAINTGAMVAGAITAKKIIHFTQLGQPVIMSPLMHHGREFTGGIPTRKIPTSIWNTIFGEFKFEGDKSFGAWYEDAADSIYRTVKKVTGGYSTGSILKGWNKNTLEED